MVLKLTLGSDRFSSWYLHNIYFYNIMYNFRTKSLVRAYINKSLSFYLQRTIVLWVSQSKFGRVTTVNDYVGDLANVKLGECCVNGGDNGLNFV